VKESGVPVGYIIGGCAIAYAIFFLLVTTAFDTNDDVGMMLLGLGFAFGGEPSAHWPFTSLLISKPVTALYRAWPALPWYALYLYSAHFVSSCILVFVVLRLLAAFPRSSVFVCLAALVSLELLILTRLQFTSAGFVLATSAIALWVHACLRGSGLVQIATAGLLFGLAYNVRTSSAEGALLFLLPVVVLAVGPALRGRQFGVLLAIPIAIGVCMLRPALAEREFGQDAAWQSYIAYNYVRGSLHLTPKLESDDGELAEAIAAVGWSPVDLYMFKNWFFTDRDVFSQARLEEILEARRRVVDPIVRGDPFAALWRHVNRSKYLFVLATALVLALCQSRRTRLLNGAFLLWGFGLIVYLILLVRFPERVSDPVALCLCVGFWLIGAIMASTDPPRWSDGLAWGVRGVAIATSCVILTQSLLKARDNNDFYARSQAAIIALLGQLERIGSAAAVGDGSGGGEARSPLFVSWAGHVPLQHLSPWVIAGDLPKIEYLGLASMTHSPPFNALLEERGIEHLPQAIFQRDDVFLIADPAHYPALIDYVREHYDLDGQIEPIGPELPWQRQVVRGRLRDAP
jgi:hypothetical protein